jgi:diguanylate cyclase (GGDEF)-like protein/PAS domain S-box-containing protein
MILKLCKQKAIFARLDCFGPNSMKPVTDIFSSRETLQAIIDEIANPIFVKDRSHRLVLVNKNFCEFLGRQKRDVVGKSDFDIVSKEQAEVFLRTDNYVFETGAGNDNEEQITDATGQIRTILTRKRLLPIGGAGPLLVGLISDITEYKEAEARIMHIAQHDALTGLANRVLLREWLEKALLRGREGDGWFAIMLLDLDDFKEINDTFGHAVGDTLLRCVADRLRFSLRASDLIARLGGDEFAILVQVSNGREECAALAGKIIGALAEPMSFGEHSTAIRGSIGIAIAPEDGSTVDAILRNSDLALYHAKSEGRNTFRVFTPELNRKHQRRDERGSELRNALTNGEFELYYQPIVNLMRDEISGVEALLRWNHPKRGQIEPCEFIPSAEETGLILPISEWVLRQACQEAASWPRHLSVAINLSIKQFIGVDLVSKIVLALAASGLAAHRLELEVTEPMVAQASKASVTMLSQLRDLGVRVVLDDFATGISSLNSLLSFPFDRLKVGQDFVKVLGQNHHQSVLLLRTIAGLGSALGMTTTVEGVDTEERLQTVRSTGFTEMQGFLFCPPRPARDIRSLLLSERIKMPRTPWWKVRQAAG